MTERTVHADVRSMLINNDPFDYCHLIKFERPSRPDSQTGRVSTSKERYTYITDASRDVPFDDGSYSLTGVANGTQNYVANKVLKLGAIAEDVEAKASTYSLVLDGTSVGAYAAGTVTTTVVDSTTYDIAWPATVDLIEEGFREGDKVTLTGISAPGDYNIQSFRTGNVLRLTKIDTTMSAQTSVAVTMTLSSEEIKSILVDKNSANYSTFLNREVFIWKAFFSEAGAMVGSPVLVFKGLISSVAFEDSDEKVTVNWGLTSHWGDWSQVAGRITSDDFHRALDENGNPNPLSSLKPLYAYDKGFSHAETSLNLLSNYTVLVEKQKIKSKNGFFGLGSKVKVKKYLDPETRTTELDFQLTAKNLQVIYGVRPVTGIPIFADTLLSDSGTVYVAYALAEGEISAIYDVYIDGNSMICGNQSDFDARSSQTADNTVQLVCKGRADRGDVLGGNYGSTYTPTSFYDSDSWLLDFGYNILEQYNYLDYVVPAEASYTASGILDQQTLVLTAPQEITFDFFSGKAAQKAAPSLVNIAATGGFKVQSDYWTGTDTAEYWGPNHRLLDTAYVVGKFKIKEGETTVPDVEFIVKGKVIPCYNYDYSYSQWKKATGESHSNFKLGATVDLHRSDTNAVINSSVQIIDKWIIYNPDGTANWRFRFSTPPALGYTDGVPSITKFYMKSGANTWTMVTYNHSETSGAPGTLISSAVNTADNSGGKVRFNFTSNADLTRGGDPTEPSPKFSILDPTLQPIVNERFGSAIMAGTDTSTTLVTALDWTTNGSYASAAVGGGNVIVSRNTIKLAAGASSTADYYVGYIITLTRTNSTTGKQIVQEKEIIAYDGTNKVATIDGVWDVACIPTTTDSYYITQKYVDHRTSINLAMQTLDYITAIYGKNLSLQNDIHFATALETARKCDAQSDVTLRLASGSAPSTGAVYKWTNTAGDILWQGTCSDSYTFNLGGSTVTYVTFSNVIGKITNLWNSWKTYAEGELVYYGNNLYKATGSYVANSTAPTHTSGTVGQLAYQSSVSITKVSGTGGATLALFISGNPVQGIKSNRISSGYSLYDSDGIDYWRYVGWEEKTQRWATKHQGNISIDTSQPIFDNVNSLLSHFGGILRYSAGKYYLELEEIAEDIATSDDEPYNITEDHIVGKIKLTDEGIRSSYNQIAASYADPSNKFEARNISFFNSEYLKTDRNVPRKGNLSIPGITNYYNARLLADRYLNKSRFGLTIALTIDPRGMLMLPGRVMQIQYSRYGWVNKKFRIESLSIAEDCLVDIVAKEYDPSFYTMSNISKQTAVGLAAAPQATTITAPAALTATELDDTDFTSIAINLAWTNSDNSNPVNTSTEIYQFKPLATITSIASNVATTATTAAAHNLVVGDVVVAFSTANGLTESFIYYVKTAPSSTTLSFSTTLGGATLSLTNGTGLSIQLGKQELLTTVPCPISTYQDLVYTTVGFVKYYRIRHKVAVTKNNGIVSDQYSDTFPDTYAIIGSSSGIAADVGSIDVDLGTDDSSIHWSGTDEVYSGWAGSSTADDAPTQIKRDGTIVSRAFEQRDESGTLHWSSATGYTDAGLNAIFINSASQLPTTNVATGTVVNRSSAPSGTVTSFAAARLGADSTVTLDVSYLVAGQDTGGGFSSFDIKLYERYSTDGVTFGSWTLLGTKTAVPSTDFDVDTITTRWWNAYDGSWEYEYTYRASGTVTLSISSAAKTAGFYEYAVMGPYASPYTKFNSVVTATDVDGTPSYILSGNGANSVNYINPLGAYGNLQLSTAASSNEECSVSCDYVIVYTPTGLPRTVRNFSGTLDLSTSGAGGLDTGTIAANTWYYVWMISTGSVDNVLGSTSSTTPTLPSGYSYKRLIGSVRTNASADIKPFYQDGNEVTFRQTATDPLGTLAAGNIGNVNTPTWVAQPTGAFIPTAIASHICLVMEGSGTGGIWAAPNNTYGSWDSTTNQPPLGVNGRNPTPGWLRLETTDIEVMSNGSNNHIRVIGYRIKI